MNNNLLQEELKRRRFIMLKDVGIVCILDFICTVMLAVFLFKNTQEVKNCSNQLFGAGVGFFAY